MLRKFLQTYKSEILALSEEKTKNLAGAKGNTDELRLGLPLFYDQLIRVLEERLNEHPPEEMLLAAASHGKEFLQLGYSLSHVVHAYGAMCQAITEQAILKNAEISPQEFNTLNGCLDVAIASAVSEFQFRSNEATENREIKHLGFLAHELRNALSSATVAHEMIKAGIVGIGGSTASILEANLIRMRNLIDRSLSEVRMRADSDTFIEKFRLSDMIDQIVITSKTEADKRKISISMDVDTKIEVEADRQYLLSAVANLLQNAVKYTKSGGKIWIKGSQQDEQVFIEVEDQCGGLETDKISSLFEPYVQKNEDRSGLGLGLTITKRAVHLSQGNINVKNKPGVGCSFIIDIPVKAKPSPSRKSAVKGKDSVQPDFRKIMKP